MFSDPTDTPEHRERDMVNSLVKITDKLEDIRFILILFVWMGLFFIGWLIYHAFK